MRIYPLGEIYGNDCSCELIKVDDDHYYVEYSANDRSRSIDINCIATYIKSEEAKKVGIKLLIIDDSGRCECFQRINDEIKSIATPLIYKQKGIIK